MAGELVQPQLRRITDHLRCGETPADFGSEYIGEGGQRVAYLNGDYVIKRHVPAWHLDTLNNDHALFVAQRDLFTIPTQTLKRCGIQPPMQRYVTGRRSADGIWVIQPFYRPLTAAERREWKWINNHLAFYHVMVKGRRRRVRLELHIKNVGIYAPTGRIHAFDW